MVNFVLFYSFTSKALFFAETFGDPLRDLRSGFAEKKEFLETIVTNAQRAHDLVELSNTARGKLGFSKHEITFGGLLDDASVIRRRHEVSKVELIGPSLRLAYAGVKGARAVHGAATTTAEHFPAKYGTFDHFGQ